MLNKIKGGIAKRWRIARVLFRDGKPFWLWLLWLLLLVTAAILITPAAEARIRWAGMFMQLSGVAGVVIGLAKTRSLFGRPKLRGAVWGWLRGFWGIVRPPSTPTVNIHVSVTGAAMRIGGGNVALTISGGSVQDRITRLEDAQDRIEREMDRIREEAARAEHRVTEAVQNEAEIRGKADDATQRQLESAIIGGITLELAGAIYLIFGIICTSIPAELAALVGP